MLPRGIVSEDLKNMLATGLKSNEVCVDNRAILNYKQFIPLDIIGVVDVQLMFGVSVAQCGLEGWPGVR